MHNIKNLLLTTSKETRFGSSKKNNNNNINNNINPHSYFLKFLDKDYNKSYQCYLRYWWLTSLFIYLLILLVQYH